MSAWKGDKTNLGLMVKGQFLSTGLITVASAILLYAFVTRDFSNVYVANYSDTTLPIFYTITAFWAGQDGSFLFWGWLIALCGAVFVYTHSYREVAVLVVDATTGVTQQDKRLLAFLEREKTPFMACVNKMDLVPKREQKQVKGDFEHALRICPYAPVLFTSTVTRAGLASILPMAETISQECKTKVTTGELNRILRTVIDKHQPPVIKRRRAKFYYLTQVGTEPPTFIFFVNDPALIKASYARYLENGVRKLMGIKHAPVRILYRSSHGEKGGKKR
jgi:hypothetical protein